jgi:RNA recognition motif-containing protein
MAKRIFVGNLPFSATEDQLRDLFSQHGEVSSVSIVTDKFTNRSRGFAFVEMASDEAATAAIAALNQHQLDGRALTVNEARERRDTGNRGGFGGERRSGGPRQGGRSNDFSSRKRW